MYMFGQKKYEEERQRKEAEKKAKKHRYLSWFLVFICGIMTTASIPSFAMVLFVAVTILLLPISKVDDLWKDLLGSKPKWIKGTSLLVAFIIACLIAPTSNTSTTEVANIEPTEVISIESTETETIEIISTERTEDTEEAITETETEIATEAETETSTAENKTTASETAIKDQKTTTSKNTTSTAMSVSLSDIPAYSGSPYVAVNNNVPFFTDNEMKTTAFENYSSLDTLGRCGVAYANVCTEIMPTEERGTIGQVKPSGWHTVKYDIVSGKYLYNRCHLIGYQLSAENANTKNLITGTRYLNTEGMLPFENMVADYVKETNNHVLYRVTPMFDGNNLVASGVLMEAKSVEDNGDGILFNVYCYNVQPGITIDYATGDSALDGTTPEQTTKNSDTKKSSSKGASSGSNNTNSGSASNETQAATPAPAQTDNNTTVQEPPAPTPADTTSNGSVIVHITDTGSKYHNAGCRYLKSDHEVTLDEAKAMGLTPCGVCNPPQ